MKDEVEFADIFEAFVEGFDEDLNQIENPELGFRTVDAKDEVEGRVVAVDQLVVRTANQAEKKLA